MKKIAAVAACSALVVSACAQTLNVREDGQSPVTLPADGSAVTHGRKAGGAENDDGNYTFYFKNGKNAAGDCDGYTVRPNGKTEIFEYFKAGINAWEKRLKDAGIPIEVSKTSNPFKYNVIRFDTNLLKGVGGTADDTTAYDATFYKDGKKVEVKDTYYIDLQPNGNIYVGMDYEKSAKLKSIGIEVLSAHRKTTIIDPDGVLFWQSRQSPLWIF